MTKARLNVGLIGAGRLGRIYAGHLASGIPGCRLRAIADTDLDAAREIAENLIIPEIYDDAVDLLDQKSLDAIVIVTPTDTHRGLVEAAASRGKAIFCEKPLSISIEDSLKIRKIVEAHGVFFQMGFMRRFDPGYRTAMERLQNGVIGKPVLFKSTSRDPHRPSLAYLDPGKSGGIFVDMGIHDFDLALWFMGPVATVMSVGGALVYPELGEIGDLDTAAATLSFADGALGLVDLSRKGVYGYDISTEILGSEGTLRIGYLRETPLLVLDENRVQHDVVPYFPERFAEAYRLQLENFVENVQAETPPPITVDDGIAALRVAIAARTAHQEARRVSVTEV